MEGKKIVTYLHLKDYKRKERDTIKGVVLGIAYALTGNCGEDTMIMDNRNRTNRFMYLTCSETDYNDFKQTVSKLYPSLCSFDI